MSGSTQHNTSRAGLQTHIRKAKLMAAVALFFGGRGACWLAGWRAAPPQSSFIPISIQSNHRSDWAQRITSDPHIHTRRTAREGEGEGKGAAAVKERGEGRKWARARPPPPLLAPPVSACVGVLWCGVLGWIGGIDQSICGWGAGLVLGAWAVWGCVRWRRAVHGRMTD